VAIAISDRGVNDVPVFIKQHHRRACYRRFTIIELAIVIRILVNIAAGEIIVLSIKSLTPHKHGQGEE
jgi:hypothetical protein